jgi:hypothetical protein
VTRCRRSEVVFIILVDVLFEVVLFLLVFVCIIIFNVFIVCIVVGCLLGLLILGLLVRLLVVIADPKVRSNYLDFCVFFINWFLWVHIGHHLRLFMN